MYKRNQARRFLLHVAIGIMKSSVVSWNFWKFQVFMEKTLSCPNFTSEWRRWVDFMQVYSLIQVETLHEKHF